MLSLYENTHKHILGILVNFKGENEIRMWADEWTNENLIYIN